MHSDIDVNFYFGLHGVIQALEAFLREVENRHRVALLEERHLFAEFVSVVIPVCVDAEELCASGGTLVQVKACGTMHVVDGLGIGDLSESVHDGNGNRLCVEAGNADDIVAELNGSLCCKHAAQGVGSCNAECPTIGRGCVNAWIVG